MQKKSISQLALLALLPSLATAQEVDSFNLKDHEVLESIIFKSLRAQEVSPFAQTNVSKETIENENVGMDIPYILQNQASVVANSDAGIGIGYTNLSIRGTDNTRINFTLNGVPINNPESQGTFLVNIPDLASSTNSIQIQRGVGSSTNGGGSFGGNVSINNMQNEDKSGGSILGTLGSYNSKRLSLMAHTGKLKNGWAIDTRLSQITSDGYVKRANSDLKAAQLLTSWAGKKSLFTLNYMIGNEKTGQAWNGLSHEQMQANRRDNTLGLMPNGKYYNNQTDNYKQHFLQAFWDQKINAFLQAQVGGFWVKGQGYYEEFREDEKYSSYGLNNPIIGTDTINRTDLTRRLWLDNNYFGALYNLRYERNNTEVTFGGMIASYKGDHFGEILWADKGNIPTQYRWYELPATKNEVNNYIKFKQEAAKNLWLTADLQYRFVNYQMQGFRKNPDITAGNTYHFINPKVGAYYNISPYSKNNNTVYASFAIANKEPNRDDFEANIAEQPKHETLNDLELGYTFSNNKIVFNANAYYMFYKNQLALNGKINDVGAYTRINVDKSYRAGIELSLAWQLHQSLSWNTNLTLSQNKVLDYDAYLDNWDNGEQNVQRYSKTNISMSPNTIGGTSLNWQPFIGNSNSCLKPLQLTASWRYIGAQYLDNSDNADTKLDAYQFANLGVDYQLEVRKVGTVMLKFSVQNVFNSLYVNKGYTYGYVYNNQTIYENYYFPQAGRHFFLTLGLKF
jgi:iron complex outermembrane receptor protein